MLKLKSDFNYQLTHMYKLIFPINYNGYYYEWQEFTFTYWSLAWEIATSAIGMHGRSAAQPRVGTHININNSGTIWDINLKN